MISVVFQHIYLLNLVVSYYRNLHSLLVKFVFLLIKNDFGTFLYQGIYVPHLSFILKLTKPPDFTASKKLDSCPLPYRSLSNYR